MQAKQNLLNRELAPVQKHFSWPGNLLSLENLENKIPAAFYESFFNFPLCWDIINYMAASAAHLLEKHGCDCQRKKANL